MIDTNEQHYDRGYEDGHDAGYTQGFDDARREGRAEATIIVTNPPGPLQRLANQLAARFGLRGARLLIAGAVLLDLGIIAAFIYYIA